MKIEDDAIIGLDIGSTKICAVVGILTPLKQLQILGVGKASTGGVSKGKIVQIDEFRRSLQRSINRASQASGGRPKKVLTNIPAHQFASLHNTGFLNIGEDTPTITQAQVNQCIEKSKQVVKSADQLLMHVLPVEHRIDGAALRSPAGKSGSHLEVTSHLILGSSENVQIIKTTLNQMNLNIAGILHDGLAFKPLFSSESDTGFIVDFGGAFTKCHYFRAGQLHRSGLVRIGGETLTRDLSICLKCSIPEAERIKILFSNVGPVDEDETQTFEINAENRTRQKIKRDLVTKILDARLVEWVNIVKRLAPISENPKTPIYIGGGSGNLKGITTFLARHFKNPIIRWDSAHLATPIANSQLQLAVGLLGYGLEMSIFEIPENKSKSVLSKIGRFFPTLKRR